MRLNFLHFFHHYGSRKDESPHLPFGHASLVQTVLTVLFLTLFGAVVIVPFVYMVVISLSVRFFDTFFESPHTALLAELTHDYDQRTTLVAFRASLPTSRHSNQRAR